MLKKGRKGPVIDRNADIPTAGLATSGLKDEQLMRSCLDIGHPEELAESLVRTNMCEQSAVKVSGFPEGPIIPSDNLEDLLTAELRKSRFALFKERFYEELYFKKSSVGKIKPAFTKPDSVTNMSRTFGRPSRLTPTTSVYSLIMPNKSVEEVNAEYTKFHEKRIVSHNRYFPGEQINRKYAHPFDRHNPSGENRSMGDTGLKVKSCLTEGEAHLKVIGKAQVDFMERTVAPLGKKFEKYLCEVPDITFGIIHPSNGDVKMALHNIIPSPRTDLLMDAISHLNVIRLSLHKREDIHLHRLMAILEQSDPDETNFLPLARILEVLHAYRIRLNAQKIRIVLSHYQMIVDEGLCAERVNYRKFCKLLSIQEPLPSLGVVATYRDPCSLDTIYRMFCADRNKKPNVDSVLQVHQIEKDETRVKVLLMPEDDPLVGGLEINDYSRLRPKAEIEQIFKNLLATDEFEAIWQSVMGKCQDQSGVASVTQFYTEMKQAKNSHAKWKIN